MSGAGKSTVCGAFKENGFSVIDCDVIARRVADKPEFLAEIGSRFTQKLLTEDGALDRPAVAELIYNDERCRDKYQRIIFPYIVYDIIQEIKRAESDVLLDAPTLFEAKLDMICKGIVSVCAPIDICAKRIAARDGISGEQAAERLSAQHSADFFRGRSDFLIENNKTVKELYSAAAKIIDKLKGQ